MLLLLLCVRLRLFIIITIIVIIVAIIFILVFTTTAQATLRRRILIRQTLFASLILICAIKHGPIAAAAIAAFARRATAIIRRGQGR